MSAGDILLLGRGGQVGWELERALAPLGRVVALGRAEVDLARPEQLREAVRRHRPRLVVNAAAYTAVDRAEGDPAAAFAVNADAPGVLAAEARRAGAFLVHYSTDYVFDGSKRAPYAEGDAPNPLNVYGRSKLAGEEAVRAATDAYLVLRTSWVYGARGTNFLRTVLRLLEEQDELRVVADQEGAPTWSRLVAEATAAVLARNSVVRPREAGVFHLSAAGSTSWHGFATAIQAALPEAYRAKPIAAIRTAEHGAPAARPAYSVLDSGKLRRSFGVALPEWDASLALVLAELAGERGPRAAPTGAGAGGAARGGPPR